MILDIVTDLNGFECRIKKRELLMKEDIHDDKIALRKLDGTKVLLKKSNQLIDIDDIFKNDRIVLDMYSKCHLFEIGVEKYKYIDILNGPVKDCNDLENILKELKYETYKKLLDEDATRDNILLNIENFKRKLEGDEKENVKEFEELEKRNYKYDKKEAIQKQNQNSIVIIYYSGHGIEKHGILPHDVKDKERDCIEFGYFKNLDFNCKHLLVILDCCYSGAIL